MVVPCFVLLLSAWLQMMCPAAQSFQSHRTTTTLRGVAGTSRAPPRGCSRLYDKKNNDEASSSLLAELRQRQQQLEDQSHQIGQLWRDVKGCQSSIALALPDWVRRIAVEYPLIACGSASGEIFLGHLDSHKILTSTVRTKKEESNRDAPTTPHPAVAVDELLLEQTCRFLYGSYDGGGTIAVTFRDKLIVDAPRWGGARLHRVVTSNADNGSNIKLLSQGTIPALDGTLVTCLELDPDYLLVGTADGRVMAFALDDEDRPLSLQQKPRYQWNLANGGASSSSTTTTSGTSTSSSLSSFSGCCPITSISTGSELGFIVATTTASSVQILSIPEEDDDDEDDDDENEEESVPVRQELQPVASFYPPFDSTERRASNAFCLAAAILKHDNNNDNKDDDTSFSIVCGGNDGSLYVQPLQVRRSPNVTRSAQSVELALTRPLFALRPFHMGAVHALVSPAPGLLASTGQDGTLRMFEVHSSGRTEDTRCLYQFAGYKVWVGSLCVADQTKLLTDGADNTVIMHDFRGKGQRKE